MDRRRLTPAEAALLLAPTAASGTKCVEAGLLGLLAAGRIAIEPAASPFKQTALHLTARPGQTTDELPNHLIALEQALTGYGKGSRLVSSQVLHALQKRFGYSFGRYVRDEVAPGLIDRGLLTREDRKWLGLIPQVRYRRTARGDALSAPVERLMEAVEQIPSLIERDPDQALRLAKSAGVLLVMSKRARRKIPALRKLMAARGGDLGPVVPLDFDDGGEGGLGRLLDLGDLALELDIGALFDGLDAVGDFTSGGDSSSSDGGDGGGGD